MTAAAQDPSSFGSQGKRDGPDLVKGSIRACTVAARLMAETPVVVLAREGPDGLTKEPPQPAPKPEQSPRRHMTNADAIALHEFKPARTTAGLSSTWPITTSSKAPSRS